MRGGPFMTHTLSAIDMALWDITGKLHGVPVYRLFGGPTRDKIRMYPTPKATKVGTGGPHPWSGNYHDIEGLVRTVEDARKRVGPDGAVMFDCHCAVPPPLLIQLAGAIHPYDVMWLEEPVVPGNIEAFKRLKEQIRVPIATGERDRTIWGMIPYLQERCVDILQPDVGQTGGISQMKKIAALAEAYFVPLAPHNTCSELGLTASLHAVASVPLFLITAAKRRSLLRGVLRGTLRLQHQREPVPPVQEALARHRPHAAVLVVRVDHLDRLRAEIDEGDDVAACALVQRAEADHRAKAVVAGLAQHLRVAVAAVLNLVAHLHRVEQRGQVFGIGGGGVFFNDAEERLDFVVAGQRLDGTPAAAPGRQVLHAALGRDVDFGPGGAREEGQGEHQGEAAAALGHFGTLDVKGLDLPSSARRCVPARSPPGGRTRAAF
jgi:hypothetical protein